MDRFSNINDLTSPARQAIPVAPSDTVDLEDIPKALHIGTAGDLVVDPVDGPGGAVLFKVSQGVFDAVRVKRVRVAGTTAGTIIGLY